MINSGKFDEMVDVRHISLDVWNTMLVPSSEYSRARSELLGEMFGVTAAEAAKLYTLVKHKLDLSAVSTGLALSNTGCIDALLTAFNPTIAADDRNRQVSNLRRSLVELFLKYPPSIDPHLSLQLRVLRGNGCTLNIISNTNFIPGAVLLPFLESRLGVKFDSALFSDEIGFAKPSPRIFNMLYHTYDAAAHEFIHVGDDAACDVQGAMNVGFRAKHVLSALETTEVLRGIIDVKIMAAVRNE